jgi:hypothetical protein
LAKIINIAPPSAFRWQDSPVIQSIAAKDKERCEKAIENYKNQQKKKKKVS